MSELTYNILILSLKVDPTGIRMINILILRNLIM